MSDITKAGGLIDWQDLAGKSIAYVEDGPAGRYGSSIDAVLMFSDGTFANRIDAAKVAIDSGQIPKLNNPPQLYSEDLW